MYRKIGFFRLQKLLVSGRIYVTEDKILCGSRGGSGVQLYPASSDNSIPSGIIAMWSGASNAIPSGWFLCDGNNNTPDLRNRFIVGAGSSYEVGATGGSDSVTLTTDQIPSHGHSASGLRCSSSGSHSHNVLDRTGSSSRTQIVLGGSHGGSSWENSGLKTDSSGSHTHTVSGSISNTGGGQSHENRPPYYALCFIMKA